MNYVPAEKKSETQYYAKKIFKKNWIVSVINIFVFFSIFVIKWLIYVFRRDPKEVKL